MRISTVTRLQYVGLATMLISTGVIFGDIGWITGVFLLFIGQVAIFYNLSSKACPSCGNNILSMSPKQQKYSMSYQSALLNVIAGRCSICKSRL
jgi:hypothetical protein